MSRTERLLQALENYPASDLFDLSVDVWAVEASEVFA
jgi:hypothetical protein